jgi:hypothetical protein
MARHPKLKQTRRTVALVGDGQTERIYFANVRDTDRPANLAIFPDYPRKIGSYKGVLHRSIALKKEGYDRVYALMDMDKIIDENKTAEYRQAKVTAENIGVIVLENNPCFEIWILLHFNKTGRLFGNCDQVVVEIQKNDQLSNYSKAERFLTAAKLYEKYKDELLKTAIPNAKRLEHGREDHSERYPRAETFRFFEWYFDNDK